MITLGGRIRHLISAKRLKQKDLAEMTDIKEPTLSEIISDKKEPSVFKVFAIAKAFDVSVEWLLMGDLTDDEKKRKKERRVDYTQPCISQIIELSNLLDLNQRKKIIKMICLHFDLDESEFECEGENDRYKESLE